jgi:SlyX protein
MSDDPHEARLVAIEIKLAEQEDTVRVLNEVVIAQSGYIERLQAQCLQLAERLSRLAEGADRKATPAEEVPPHY